MVKVKHPLTEEEAQEQIENSEKEQKPSMPSVCKTEMTEMYIDGGYEFRYNKIKSRAEFRNREDIDHHFKPADKRFLASLKRQLDKVNLSTSINNLHTLLISDFSQEVNPITEYFEALVWDGIDHIKQLADTVKVVNTGHWDLYFKKWLIGVTANANTEIGCQNHCMLVLTGSQGKFKTTWLDNLCPKDLKIYLFTGKIDPTSKDSLTYVAEFFLINIDDQLKQLNKKDENDLKNLITTPSVKYRKPYDIDISEFPHTSSFMGSVNGNEFLTDPTGSRRFLPFEVENIDINTAVKLNIDQVWAQAYHLWKKGEYYWFADEEATQLHEHNQAFHVISTEEQLILSYFRKPERRSDANCFLQSAEIQSILETKARLKLYPKKIGEAFTHLGYEKWQKTENNIKKWVYSLYMIPDEERNLEQKKTTIEDIKDEFKTDENGKLPF